MGQAASMKESLMTCFLGTLGMLILSLVLGGCAHTDIAVPFDAPLMLSQDETLHSPYVRQHKTWVQVNGTVTRHKGDVVTSLPATQP